MTTDMMNLRDLVETEKDQELIHWGLLKKSFSDCCRG